MMNQPCLRPMYHADSILATGGRRLRRSRHRKYTGDTALPEEVLDGVEQSDFELPPEWVDEVKCGPPPPKYR